MVRTAVIGVDVGGTKIHAVGMEAQKGPQPLVLFSKQIAAERATPTVFCDRLAHFIQDLINDGRSRGYVLDSHIGLGMPGRYVLDPQGGRVVAPGTAPNLGRTAHDFDGLDPAHELSRRLPECSFSIHNDAVAQMRYALELLLRNEKTTEGLRGQRICYLGPGTGLGGGFAKIRSDGPVDIRTDGHVFDIVVEPSGVTLPVEGGGHRMEIHRLGTAEELVSDFDPNSVNCPLALSNQLKFSFLVLLLSNLYLYHRMTRTKKNHHSICHNLIIPNEDFSNSLALKKISDLHFLLHLFLDEQSFFDV